MAPSQLSAPAFSRSVKAVAQGGILLSLRKYGNRANTALLEHRPETVEGPRRRGAAHTASSKDLAASREPQGTGYVRSVSSGRRAGGHLHGGFSHNPVLPKIGIALISVLLLPLACQAEKGPPPNNSSSASDEVRRRIDQPFLIVRNGDIYRVDALGNEKQLTQAPIDRGAYIKDPSRSPDGNKIVYSYIPPVQRTQGAVVAVSGAQLWTMNADGSDQQMLLKDNDPAGRFEHAVWSPDGLSIFYTYFKPIYENGKFVDTELNIERLDLNGMTRNTIEKNGYYPAVSKDGRFIVFLRLSSHLAQSLIVKELGRAEVKELIKGGEFSALSHPRFSPDSNTIAFVASGEHMPTARQDGDQKGRTLRLPEMLSVAEANGLPWDVWSIKVEGSGLTRITELNEDSPSMDWSNDGRYIAIIGINGLFVAEVNEKKTVSISNNGAFHGQIDWAF